MKRRIAIPTLHRKGDQIIPAFKGVADFELFEVPLDTDSFGTFSGEIERTLSPRDAALAKARSVLASGNWDGAIASEGSIGPDPYLPFMLSDREILVYLDRDDLLIEETYRSFEIITARLEFCEGDDLTQFLESADFPRHQLIVSARIEGQLKAIKGIDSHEALHDAIGLMMKESQVLTIESDLRAHASPSRQQNIAAVATRLAKRISQKCPECSCIGWGRVDHLFGVECVECGHLDQRTARQVIDGCARCDHRLAGEVLREGITAGECELCNP